jgi:superfamily I DNA/RNA helicase
MNFRIADTFTASLARLTGDEQKASKTTAFDLQMQPAGSGLSFHKLDRAKDKNFWSVRVSSDLRLIVHKSEGSLLLCYVDHHDAAYAWAERRKLETHPSTGAAQWVQIRETMQEVLVPVFVQAQPVAKSPRVVSPKQLFTGRADEELLGYGVPPEWLNDVKLATEDTLLTLAEHLPAKAAEALLELATGGKPRAIKSVSLLSPFDHRDAQRRFRVMSNIEELQAALEYPWEKWTVFLHPEQRQWVERDYNGPARVSGSAGTGKTIVALHRAAHLARTHPDARVLLCTYSDTLAHALRAKLGRLLTREPRLGERIDVHALEFIGTRLYKANCGPVNIASVDAIQKLIEDASKAIAGHKFSLRFLLSEWEQLVDAWQLKSWEDYRNVPRLGRKTRLAEPQRAQLWSIFERVIQNLAANKQLTYAGMFTELAVALAGVKKAPFDYVMVDEAQDLSIAHLRFLAALMAQGDGDALFFAGDLGQRIFQTPFSWRALGVDIRGRSRNLRINYRTSHQIRLQADRLLDAQLSDVDGNSEIRNDTVSVFNGPEPLVRSFRTEAEEIGCGFVAAWLREQSEADGLLQGVGVFVRSEAQLPRAEAAVRASGLASRLLDHYVETTDGAVAIGTMHLAKGLEFRAVAVMACDDEVIPSQERVEAVGDEADLLEVYDTERHLLSVACTRARDHLLVTSAGNTSEFLDDLMQRRSMRPV